MATKKSKKTGASSKNLVHMSSADLLTAGVADFKLTKEDLIDLLVEEATALAEANLEEAKARQKAANGAVHDIYELIVEEQGRLLLKPYEAQLRQIRKLFPEAEREVVTVQRTSARSKISVTFLGPLLTGEEAASALRENIYAQREEQNYKQHADSCSQPAQCRVLVFEAVFYTENRELHSPKLTLLNEQRLKAMRQYEAEEIAVGEARDALYAIQDSTKKLRVQLIRKVLASNKNGENILANVELLSAQFLASFRKA